MGSVVVIAVSCAGRRELRPDVTRLDDASRWTSINIETRSANDGDKHAVAVSPIGGNRKGSNVGMAIVRDLSFQTGTIDVDLRGAGEEGASFLGVAFGVIDATRYEAVYFRPFRFRAEDPVEHAHAVQYVAWPEHTWEALRKRAPGTFEAAIAPTPDPAGWFHAHLEVGPASVKVFIDGAPQPTLVVERLRRDAGGIALWVDSKAGSFANLRVDAHSLPTQ